MSDTTECPQRKTVRRCASLVGRSLANGEDVVVTLRPAGGGSGIIFRNLRSGVEIPATLRHVADVPHCTALRRAGGRVEYVEHLMAALAAMGVTDVLVEVSGDQLPLLDGSAAPYAALVEEAEPAVLSEAIQPIELVRPVLQGADRKVVVALPGNTGYWYFLDHPHPLIGWQVAGFWPPQDDFTRHVAPARTFASEEEARALIESRDLAGAEETMAIIAYRDRLSAPEPFSNSFAMHKIIDLMGDLYLLGRPLRATVIAFRTGHRDNRALAHAISEIAGAPGGSFDP